MPSIAQLHQAGQSAFEASAGTLDGFRLPHQDNFGYFLSASYSKYRSRYLYWKIGAQLNQKSYAYDVHRVPFSQWLGKAEIYTRVLGQISRSWVVNAGVGVAGGYESIPRTVEGARIMNGSNWVVGPTVSLEGEYLLNGRTILVLRVQEFYLFRSSVTRTRFNLGVGVKFTLSNPQDE